MKRLLLCLALVTNLLQAETLVDDKFAEASLPGRRMMRGDWKLTDGAATCTQNDELFKKYKDHGPVMWYDAAFTNGSVKFAFRPQGAKTFVFTVNNDKGHVFRFVMTPDGLSVRAWPTQGHETKALSLLSPKPGSPALKDGEWLPVDITFTGKTCTLKVGSFTQSFENEAIALPKTVIGLGFSFGTLSVRDVQVTRD